MRVCGIEIKSGAAIICLLDYLGDTFNVPDCRKHSFYISATQDSESIREFHFTFSKLMTDYKVDQVVIIQRHERGKRAASVDTFKMEAAIQLAHDKVSLLPSQAIKAQMKRNPPQVDFEGLDLKKFQQNAFEAAYAYHNQLIYQPSE